MVTVLRGETRRTLQFLPGTANKCSDTADPTFRLTSAVKANKHVSSLLLGNGNMIVI